MSEERKSISLPTCCLFHKLTAVLESEGCMLIEAIDTVVRVLQATNNVARASEGRVSAGREIVLGILTAKVLKAVNEETEGAADEALAVFAAALRSVTHPRAVVRLPGALLSHPDPGRTVN